MNKYNGISKLSLEFLGYILLSAFTALFSFAFLYYMSISVADRIIEKRTGNISMISDPDFLFWLGAVCFAASAVIFFAFFIFFSGQKIHYLLTITRAVQMLEGGKLDLKIAVEGKDELSELAESLNQFSCELHKYIQKEEEAKQEKQALVRSLSHDIRTPLTVIISYSDFIRTGRYDSEENLIAYANCIQEKACRIQGLTELLLEQKELGGETPAMVDGKLLLEQILTEFSDTLEEEGYTARITKLPEKPFDARLAPQDMLRIFDNLYSNILKYADKTRDIVVGVVVEDGYLKLTQENAVQKIGTEKVHENQVTQTKSYGIGLQNIRRITEKYSGNMKSHSDGCRFQIELLLRYL